MTAPFLKRVFSFAKPYKKVVLLFTITSIGLLPLHVLEPLVAKHLLDLALSGKGLSTDLKEFTLAWAAIYTCTVLLHLSARRSSIRLRSGVVGEVRTALYRKLLRLPQSYFDKNATGYIASRQTDDADNLDGLMSDSLIEVGLAVIESAVILTLVFKLNTSLALVLLITTALSIRSQFLFDLKELYRNHNEAKAELNKELVQTISGITVVKCSVNLATQVQKYTRALDHFIETKVKREVANVTRGVLSRVFADITTPLIVLTSAWLIIEGKISVSVSIAAILYQRRLIANVPPIVSSYPLFHYAVAAYQRIFAILDDNEENMTSIEDSKRAEVTGNIEFRDVSFTYDGKEYALKNVSFNIKPGQLVALVGTSGSGKSTVAKLILGLYECSEGNIFFDGVSIKEIPLNRLRKRIGFVPQDPFLFNGSIKENISCGLEKFRDSVVELAAETAEAHSFICLLPKGFDTPVGDRGLTLSGGERQRICIAREIARNTNVILFDEATSALDAVSESQIRRVFNTSRKDKACFVITHKLSTIQDADIILVFDQGKLVETGTHQTLMGRGGHYHRLCQEQIMSGKDIVRCIS
ncbi:MAG: ABC transporter ATP-binding protein [Peptococcaceae bacterium]|nr:ABC transporter ATP-binding protein [Peptococcaceae bacterium]